MKKLYKKITCLFLIVLFSSQYVYGTEKLFQFDDVALNDILIEIGNYYSINFIYNDELLKGCKATCALGEDNADAAIQKVLSSFNLASKKINEKTYVIYYEPLVNSDNKNMATRIGTKRTPVIIPPKAISNIQIPYPKIARESGFEGSVEMKILIDENGNVDTVKIQKSSNSIILDKAAVNYTKQIKFKPAQSDSQSISVWSKWKIIFDLVPSDTTYTEVVFKNINE